MSGFRFAYPHMLLLLWLVPVFVILIWLWARKYKQNLASIGQLSVVRQMMPEARYRKKLWRSILMLVIFVLGVLVVARPQIGSEKAHRKVKGSEIVLVMDVSNSMLARPNANAMSRLDIAKMAAMRMLSRMRNDLVAVVIFAGDAALVVPMTDDYSAVGTYISGLSTSYIERQGTAISDALQLAINAFTPNKNVNKAIVLFSDGEDLEGKADQMVALAKSKGIRIYTAGVGSVRGNPIYLPNGGLLYYHGQVVISRQHPKYLQQIAAATGGAYIDITNHPDKIDFIYNQIEKHASGSVAVFSHYADLYPYLIGLILLLLLIEIMTNERVNRLLQKIKLFEK